MTAVSVNELRCTAWFEALGRFAKQCNEALAYGRFVRETGTGQRITRESANILETPPLPFWRSSAGGGEVLVLAQISARTTTGKRIDTDDRKDRNLAPAGALNTL
jgi:hypothetical protein